MMTPVPERRFAKEGRRSDDHKKAAEADTAKHLKQIATTVPALTFKFARLVFIGMVVQLLVIGYVFITEHNGRQDSVNAAREGCERDKLDRTASVTLNENILIAFQEGQEQNPKVKTETRQAALEKIKGTTAGLRERADINCTERYPDARWFP